MDRLSIPEALAIVQSDMKLWDSAETSTAPGGKVVKTINLPWGVGEVSVTLEGMNSAQGKRNAVGAYGQYIRELVKDATDDEAVTARAKAAAARAEQDDSGDSVLVGSGGLPLPATQEKAVQKAENPYSGSAEGPVDFGAALVARRTEVLRRYHEHRAAIEKYQRELKALDAAVAALGDYDASKNEGADTAGAQGAPPEDAEEEDSN